MGSRTRALRKSNPGGKRKGELRIYEVGVEATTEELENSVRQGGPNVIAEGNPFYITVSGFDDDPRELSEIPEVAALCQRIIDSGFFGLVGDNADLGVDKTNELVDMHICYHLAKGSLLKTGGGWGRAFMTPEVAKDFLATTEAANEKVNRLLAEPKPAIN